MNLTDTQRRRIEALVAETKPCPDELCHCGTKLCPVGQCPCNGTGTVSRWPWLVEAMHRVIPSCYCCTPDCLLDGCDCSHGKGIEIEPAVAEALVGLEQDLTVYAVEHRAEFDHHLDALMYGWNTTSYHYSDSATRLDALLQVAESTKEAAK